jgi:TolB-like protein
VTLQEHFTDGIQDDIITDLAKIGGLAVVARNSGSPTRTGR